MAKIRVFQHFCLSSLLNVSKKMPTLHFFCLRFCFCQHSLFQNQFLQNSWINRLLRWPKLQNRSWLEVFVVKEIKTANFVQKTQTEYSDETTNRFKQHYFYQTSLTTQRQRCYFKGDSNVLQFNYHSSESHSTSETCWQHQTWRLRLQTLSAVSRHWSLFFKHSDENFSL